MMNIQNDTENSNAELAELAERVLQKAPPDTGPPDKGPDLRDPVLWMYLGVPALRAYRDAYLVAQRIERGCTQSMRGYRDGLSAQRAGGRR